MSVWPTDVNVSVVIPCRNPGRHLQRMLESLAVQRFHLPWEVVLVDNGGSEALISACRPLFDRLTLRVVRATGKASPSYARNVGARLAAGSKILFVDADDEVGQGYIAAMAEALDVHPVVTSRVDSVSLNPEWVRGAHGPPWQESGLVTFFDFLPGTGSNIGLRRTVFEEAGPIPEEFLASEDIAYSWRLQLENGLRLHLVPRALYRYRYRHSLWGLFWQSRRWGESNVLLYRKFRDAGMPGRTWRMAFSEWRQLLAGLLRVRGWKDLAPLVVRAGCGVGRIAGSVRHRTFYV